MRSEFRIQRCQSKMITHHLRKMIEYFDETTDDKINRTHIREYWFIRLSIIGYRLYCNQF